MKLSYVVFESYNNNYYLYDGTSSNIFSISQNLYKNHNDIISNICNEFHVLQNQKNLPIDTEELINAITEGVFAERSVSDLEYWFDRDNYIKNDITNMVQLMLGVTEKCNLRCKYCIYGGHYENERVHSSKNMDLNTLKNALNYFWKTSRSKEKVVNFYGGEPFMNFSLLKKAVELINEIDSSVKILITTNGMLLKEDIARWFIDNKNVHIFVSIAGIPKTHDRFRVTIENMPTYSIIKQNLIKIKEYDFNDFNERVNIVFNLFDESQLFELNEFWKHEDLFLGLRHSPEITFIDCFDDDGAVKEMAKEIKNENKHQPDPLSMYIEYLKEKKYDNLIVKYYDEKFLAFHRRSDDCENKICGVCRPFVKKIFVSTNGDVHMCENFIYNKHFGNVNNQVYIEKVDKFLSIYAKDRNKTCKECWAQKICSLCFRDLYDKDGQIAIERSSKVCQSQRKLLLEILKQYCTVLENDDTLLDHLDEYIVSF